MSKVGEYYREREEMGLEPEIFTVRDLEPEADPVSNCCSAPFTYPGWPDSDTCSECMEHADIGEDE